MKLRQGVWVAFTIVGALPGVAFAQSVQKLPEFEVASIKPYVAPPVEARAGTVSARLPDLTVNESRLVNIFNLNLRDLVALAYGVGGSQVVAPAWQTDPTWTATGFAVVAKVPADGDKKDAALMLRALLAERFHLVAHHEKKTIPVFALKIGKGRLKLVKVNGDDVSSTAGCTRSFGSQPAWFTADCKGMTSARMAQAIQRLGPSYFDKPVVDLTGLTGIYDFSVEWVTRASLDNGGGGPSMFAAVEKLGLKFVSTKHPMDLVVVDHCDKQPTEN
jgi:uncharacterized protein (TIGR03435 family)